LKVTLLTSQSYSEVLFILEVVRCQLVFLNVNKKILGAIQESEERLQQGNTRLAESEKQLEQAQLVIDSIKKDAETTARQVKSNILTEGKMEIERLTATAKSQIGTVEARVRKQISDYVVTLALKRVTLQLEGKLNPSLQQQIIDRNISKLGD